MRVRGAFLILAVMAAAADSRAQVNVEPLRQQLDAEGWGAQLRAAVAGYAGNTEGVILGSAAFAGARSGAHVGYVALSGDYARLNGVVSVAKWFAHLRHNYRLGRLVTWEEYAQMESDRFRRVTLRQLIGTGPRFTLFETTPLQLYYGASYLLEHTHLATERATDSGQGTAHRFSHYLALRGLVHERIALSSVAYAQPRFDRPRDLHLLWVSSADFTVTERLHSRLDATLRYSSVLPGDVAPADLELKNSLELRF